MSSTNGMQLGLQDSPMSLYPKICELNRLAKELAGIVYDMAQYYSYLNALVCLHSGIGVEAEDELSRIRNRVYERSIAVFNKAQNLSDEL